MKNTPYIASKTLINHQIAKARVLSPTMKLPNTSESPPQKHMFLRASVSKQQSYTHAITQKLQLRKMVVKTRGITPQFCLSGPALLNHTRGHKLIFVFLLVDRNASWGVACGEDLGKKCVRLTIRHSSSFEVMLK